MTAGNPCAQRTATRRNGRAGRPSCQETTAWSSIGSSYPGPHRPSPANARDDEEPLAGPHEAELARLPLDERVRAARRRSGLERLLRCARARRPRPCARRPRRAREVGAERVDVGERRSREARRRRASAGRASGGADDVRIGGMRVGATRDQPDSPAPRGLLPATQAVSTLIRFVVPGMFTAVPAVMTTRSPGATIPVCARRLERPGPQLLDVAALVDLGRDDAPLDRELLGGVALVRRRR